MRIYFATLPEKAQKESLDKTGASHRLYSYYFFKDKSKEQLHEFIGRPEESMGHGKTWQEKLKERTVQAVKDWMEEKEKRNAREKRKAKREAFLERRRKKHGAAITGYVETPQGRWPHYEKSKAGWRYLFVKQISMYVEELAKEIKEATKEDLLDHLATSILRIIDGGDCAKMNEGMKKAGIPRMTITIDHEVIHGEEDKSLLDEYEQIMRRIREKWKVENKKAKGKTWQEKLRERTLREISARQRERSVSGQ